MLALRAAQRVPSADGEQAEPPPASILLISDGAQTQGRGDPGAGGAPAHAPRTSPSTRSASARRTASSSGSCPAASPSASACRRTRTRCASWRQARGGEFFVAADDERLRTRLRGARVAARHAREGGRDHRRVRRRRHGAAAPRGRAVHDAVQEAAMKRVLILALTRRSAERSAPTRSRRTSATASTSASACPGRGWSCPARASGRLATVEYQLACPRGSIAGGLDAVLGHRALVRSASSAGSAAR